MNDEIVDDGPDAESLQSSEDAILLEEPPIESERSRRVIRFPPKYDDCVTSFILSANHACAYVALTEEDEPCNFIQEGI